MFVRTFAKALIIAMAATAPPPWAGSLPGPAAPAAAQTSCAPRAVIVPQLERRHGETQRGLGLSGPRRLFELWTAEGGSWTILMSLPDGRACIMASGLHWHDSAKPLAGTAPVNMSQTPHKSLTQGNPTPD